MKDTRKFSLACILILGLQRPVSVKVRRGAFWKHPECGQVTGLWEGGEGHRHTIQVCIAAKRGNWQELIAHEMAHAFCNEFHPKASDHGRTWQRVVSGLKRDLKTYGFNVRNIYHKGADK